MRHAACLILGLTLAAHPVAALDLAPGLVSARLLPGWTDAQGNRVSALELRLAPGWKTYWRSPGDAGLPPSFDWQGSGNLAAISLHWPTPEVIRSGGEMTLGYHDTLLLPFTAHAADPAQPVSLIASVDFGLCEKICVPAHVDLQAPPPEAVPDPQIEAALDRVPDRIAIRPACHVAPIEDGVTLSLLLPASDAQAAAVEIAGRPDIWVSAAELSPETDGLRTSVDVVPPSVADFALEVDDVRVTVIGPDGAVEMQGCDAES